MSKQRARRAGFTLTELMVVVAVVAISAGLAAPAMYTGFANRRTGEAGGDLVTLVNRARAEAGAYGRAHLLRYTDGGGANGSFTLFRGISSSCGANPWVATIIPTAQLRVGVMDLDAAGSRYTTGSLSIRARELSGATLLDICYEPNGRVVWRKLDDPAPFTEGNTVNGGFVFTFDRMDGATPVGVQRRVAIPLGGHARVMQ